MGSPLGLTLANVFVDYFLSIDSNVYTVMFIERQIKALKMFSLKTWCTKKPFGYRVAHHGYLLTSCPGQL